MAPTRKLVSAAVTLQIVAALALAVFLAGCGGSDSAATGTVRVALTDAAGTFEKVVLAVREIRLVRAGGEGLPTGAGLPLVVSFATPVAYDVTTLAYAQEVLGEAAAPAGSYSQVRLVLAPNPTSGDPVNYVTLKTDPLTKIPLDTPSGQQSGLKVVGRYDVAAGEVTALALDFDPSRAIVSAGSSGKYLIKPTGIRIVKLSGVLPAYGSISGNVTPGGAWTSAVVSVIPRGSTAPIAAGSVNPDDGSFRALVPAGEYALRITATGYATYDSRALVTPIYYTATIGADTSAGTITLAP